MDTGHYTQQVWASTGSIGCGMVTYKSGDWNNNYIVCNYGEGESFISCFVCSSMYYHRLVVIDGVTRLDQLPFALAFNEP